MTINELIRELYKYKKKHGDDEIEVCVHLEVRDSNGDYDEIIEDYSLATDSLFIDENGTPCLSCDEIIEHLPEYLPGYND